MGGAERTVQGEKCERCKQCERVWRDVAEWVGRENDRKDVCVGKMYVKEELYGCVEDVTVKKCEGM